MKTFVSVLATALFGIGLLALAVPAEAGIFANAQVKRDRADLVANHTLESLLATDAKAKRLYERSYGYAVFSVTKGAFFITGGGGTGVAVHRLSDERTYMHMGQGGIGLGIGGQAFRLVMLFEDEQTFQDFVDSDWHASSSANAVAGRNGINAEASFVNGLAIYQVTEAGLLLSADIAGTRYWRSNRLNRAQDAVRTAAATAPVLPETATETVEYEYATQTTVYPLEAATVEPVTEYESSTQYETGTEYRPD